MRDAEARHQEAWREAWRSAVSFSKLAKLLSAYYGETITRQRVYEWWKRGTKNAAGQPFPREVRELPGVPVHRPRRHFDVASVVDWCEPGVPGMYGMGWVRLGNFNAPIVVSAEGWVNDGQSRVVALVAA
jgi:hypothetical protein